MQVGQLKSNKAATLFQFLLRAALLEGLFQVTLNSKVYSFFARTFFLNVLHVLYSFLSCIQRWNPRENYLPENTPQLGVFLFFFFAVFIAI